MAEVVRAQEIVKRRSFVRRALTPGVDAVVGVARGFNKVTIPLFIGVAAGGLGALALGAATGAAALSAIGSEVALFGAGAAAGDVAGDRLIWKPIEDRRTAQKQAEQRLANL